MYMMCACLKSKPDTRRPPHQRASYPCARRNLPRRYCTPAAPGQTARERHAPVRFGPVNIHRVLLHLSRSLFFPLLRLICMVPTCTIWLQAAPLINERTTCMEATFYDHIGQLSRLDCIPWVISSRLVPVPSRIQMKKTVFLSLLQCWQAVTLPFPKKFVRLYPFYSPPLRYLDRTLGEGQGVLVFCWM